MENLPLDSAKAALKRIALKHGALIKMQGDLVQMKRYHFGPRSRPAAKRGKVLTFTRPARLRLLKFIAVINYRHYPKSLFVTLTYPDMVADKTPREMNIERYLFLRKVEEHLGKKISAVWRIEWLPRESGKRIGQILPHVHVILLGVRWIPWQSIRAWWKRVIHVKGYCRTDVEGIKGKSGALGYVAKYIAKVDPNSSLVNASYLNNSGRHYGYHRKDDIHQEEYELIPTASQEEIKWILEMTNDVIPWRNKSHIDSFTVLGKNARKIANAFRERFLVKGKRHR